MVGSSRVWFETIDRNATDKPEIPSRESEDGSALQIYPSDRIVDNASHISEDGSNNDGETQSNTTTTVESNEEETECIWPCYNVRKLFGCAHVELHEAILDGHFETVQKTLQRILSIALLGDESYPREKLNGYDDKGRTPLSLAVKINRSDIVDLLLTTSDRYIDVDLVDEHTSMTPLHHAAHYCGTMAAIDAVQSPSHDNSNSDEDNLLILSLLLKKGASVDPRDGDGRTPLMIACGTGKVDFAFYLLKAHADPELQDNAEYGWNSLFYAVRGGHADVVKLLLSEGMDKKSRDKKHAARPIDWAKLKKHDDIVSILEAHTSKLVITTNQR